MNHYQLEPYSKLIFQIGDGFGIAYYAVFILTGALLALILGIKEGKKIGVSKPFLEDLVLYGLPIAIVGTRIWYVALEWDYFKNNLHQIYRIDEGGLAIHGGIVAAAIYGYFFCKKRGVNFLKAVDLAAPGFLIAQAMGRWGNFMNQEAHGGMIKTALASTDKEFYQLSTQMKLQALDQQRAFLSDKLHLPDFITNQMFLVNEEYVKEMGEILPLDRRAYYHPTFLYESIWNLIGFGLILYLRRTKKFYVGDLGLIYLIWYSIGRFFIEALRTDPLVIGNTGIRMAQLTSIVFLLVGAITLFIRHYKKIYPKYYYEFLVENKDEGNHETTVVEHIGVEGNVKKENHDNTV